MRRLIGIGYRHPLATWIDADPPQVRCLEITAEHFFDHGQSRLRELSRKYPVFLHGLGLSLGTPGPMDDATVRRFVDIAKTCNPMWISEHVAFTRSGEIDLGHLNPINPTQETLRTISDHAIELSQRCAKPLILENITSHLRMAGEMSETEFLNRLCDEADCGLLLDVTNLYINSRNHRFDPLKWLHEINPKRIVQLHVVGYSHHDNAWHDDHAAPIQDDLLALAKAVVDYAPVKAAIIERDADFPPADLMAKELERLEAAIGGD